jgi:hypothetical protein
LHCSDSVDLMPCCRVSTTMQCQAPAEGLQHQGTSGRQSPQGWMPTASTWCACRVQRPCFQLLPTLRSLACTPLLGFSTATVATPWNERLGGQQVHSFLGNRPTMPMSVTIGCLGTALNLKTSFC